MLHYLICLYLVFPVLATVPAIAVKTFIHRKMHAIFTVHLLCSLESRILCGICNFGFTVTLTYMRVDRECRPCISGDKEIAEPQGARQLVSQPGYDILS